MQTAEIDALIARVEGLTGEPDGRLCAELSVLGKGTIVSIDGPHRGDCGEDEYAVLIDTDGGRLRMFVSEYDMPGRSLDATIALAERMLPGWAWQVGTCSVSDDAWLAPDLNDRVHGDRLRREFSDLVAGGLWDIGIDIDRRPPGKPALAMLEAVLRAYRNKGSGARE